MSAPQACRQARARLFGLSSPRAVPSTRKGLSIRADNHLKITVPECPFSNSPARSMCKYAVPLASRSASFTPSPLANTIRKFSTSLHLRAAPPVAPHATEPTPLSTDQYHKLSDAYIDILVAKLEQMQEEREDVDVEYSAGVLTLAFPPSGTYVLNKQPPNRQIWLSSPVSGPKRYDWVASKTGGGEAPEGGLEEGKEGEWVYLRDGSTLSGLFEEEIGVVPGTGEEED